MAYNLQAIIGHESLLCANRPKLATIIALPQNQAMIPLCDELLDSSGIPFLPLTDGGRPGFEEALGKFVLPLVGRGKFVYVEAEFFGGDGTQASVMWDTSGKPSSPVVAVDAINQALGFLGIAVHDSLDEFEALGLGKHRETQGWLTETKVKI